MSAIKLLAPTARINLMKACYTMALAVRTGVGIGGLAVRGIYVQAKPPAYYVAEIDVTNEDLYNK